MACGSADISAGRSQGSRQWEMNYEGRPTPLLGTQEIRPIFICFYERQNFDVS